MLLSTLVLDKINFYLTKAKNGFTKIKIMVWLLLQLHLVLSYCGMLTVVLFKLINIYIQPKIQSRLVLCLHVVSSILVSRLIVILLWLFYLIMFFIKHFYFARVLLLVLVLHTLVQTEMMLFK